MLKSDVNSRVRSGDLGQPRLAGPELHLGPGLHHLILMLSQDLLGDWGVLLTWSFIPVSQDREIGGCDRKLVKKIEISDDWVKMIEKMLRNLSHLARNLVAHLPF